MANIDFLNLNDTISADATELKAAAARVIDSGRFLNGEETKQLEKTMANLCGTKFCVAVSNGLDALRLIIRGYKEIGVLCNGDEIIVPANTYIASVLAITDNQLKPVFCDASLLTLNLDTSHLNQVITPKTRAIMPVHLYGTPCWDEQLQDFAIRNNLLIIEDNAQAIGAKASTCGINNDNFITGGLGHAAGNSFYPTKNIGALGDAGAVTTDDEKLATAIRALANYGSDYRYHNIYQGLNCRIDEIQAAFLNVRLQSLPKIIQHRSLIASIYDNDISNKAVVKPVIFSNMQQVWHQYVIRTAKRDELRSYLNVHGVSTDIHYPTPPYKQPCYGQYNSLAFTNADLLAHEVISLPVANCSEEEAKEIAAIINQFH